MKKWKIRLLENGVTQKEFCKRIGLNYTLFSAYITNVKKPSDKMVERIETGMKEMEIK